VKVFRGTVVAGVGAAVLLLSACGSGGGTASPTSSPKPTVSAVEKTESGTADPTKAESGTADPTNAEKPASGQAGETVEVSIVKAVRDDGTVEYQVARFVPAETNNRKVEAVDETVRTAPLAADAVFLSTQGCDTGNPVGLAVDQRGLGTVPCEREAYAAMTPDWTEYAPSLFFNGAGEIVKMANHYHP